MNSIYDDDMPRREANFAALSPIHYLVRAASVYPHRTAIIYGALRQTWGDTYRRCRQLAHALVRAGVDKNDTVAVMLPNTPAMVESHFGAPMAGAVLNAMNTRLDAETIAYMLDHSEAKAVIVDPEFSKTMKAAIALRKSGQPLLVIDALDPLYAEKPERIGSVSYEDFLADGDPEFNWIAPADEWDAIALNYTSGTTGRPKGVVYHHRGAALNAIANVLEWDMPKHAVYLWTLPLFHANGWCFAWTLAARAGVNVCLRRVETQAIFDAMRAHGVTHYCGAPIVQSMLINAPETMKVGLPRGIKTMVAGAAPPASMIEGMERMGFDLTHVYGLTEVYGPVTVCAKQQEWDDLDIGERARLNARQGVRNHMVWDVRVRDPRTLQPVPWDGETMGEIMFQGNIAMKGYLKDPVATSQVFSGGWFHSGDLAVQYPDGYMQIKDRSKDIIISGGENISSIEIEDVLYRHPAVVAAAVVAKPDERWGETPCAFVELRPSGTVTEQELLAHCKRHLAGFKVPRAVVFGELPKTNTGKIQKFELRKRAVESVSPRLINQ